MTLSWPFLAVIAGSLVLYLLVIPRLTVSYPGLLVQGPPDPYHAAVASASTIAQSHTGEKRFIVAGDPTICVDSSRLCVPGLVDTSYVRIGTGRLTSAQAIRLTSRRKAKMVFLGRGLCQLKPYDAWVRSNYRLLANMPNLAGGCGGAWIR